MKLYDSKVAPNPRRARIFLAEKGITVPTEQVDIMLMQQKTSEYTAINPLQRMPSLVLDDGTVITEFIAICRYFEMLHPEPPMFGVGAKDAAVVEMWNSTGGNKFSVERRGGVPSHSSGDERVGGAASAGLGRCQQAARHLVSRNARPRTCHA